MKNKGSIRHRDTTITYQVVRSERRKKTISTMVSLDIVRVLAPTDATDRELEDLIRKQAPRILDRREELKRRPAPKKFVTGETLPYLGRDVQMNVNTDQFLRPWVRFDNGHFWIDAPPDRGEEERRELIHKAFVEWYRHQAADYLPERVENWVPRRLQHRAPDPDPRSASALGELRSGRNLALQLAGHDAPA